MLCLQRGRARLSPPSAHCSVYHSSLSQRWVTFRHCWKQQVMFTWCVAELHELILCILLLLTSLIGQYIMKISFFQDIMSCTLLYTYQLYQSFGGDMQWLWQLSDRFCLNRPQVSLFRIYVGQIDTGVGTFLITSAFPCHFPFYQ